MTNDSPPSLAASPVPVLRSAALVGAMTAISRIAGLLREQLMAYAFGTGLAKSAFVVAFTIPNLFRRLFGEGALSAAFIPVYIETREREGLAEANRLVGRVAGLLVAVLGILTAIGILLALALQQWCVPPESRWSAILPLLRIMLPYAPLICLAALAMGILNALRHFAMPALTPVFLNLVWIFTLLVICPWLPEDPFVRIHAVAWAVVVAGVVQVAVQLPALARRGVTLRLLFSWQGDARIRRILLLMTPMMVGVGAFQINVVVDGFLAMWAAPWAPAAVQYADLIVYLPLGLIGTAFGTVLLPTFSRQAARDSHDELRATLESTLRHVLVIATPAAIGLTVLALPIVEILYVWPNGEFAQRDAVWTMRALAALAPGILFFSLQKALTPAFYAMQDTRTPLRVALWGVGMNFVMNVVFVVTWPDGWKHVGLMVSTVLVSLVNTITLAREMHKRIGAPRWHQLAPTGAGVLLAAAGMGVVARASHAWLTSWLHTCGPIERAVQSLLQQHSRALHALGAKLEPVLALGGAMLAAAVVYALLTYLLCRPALSEIIADLRHRKKK
ncbi:MAG: murein biosynthesis integral membrane protein MurJ [Kiritimatiellia bacterium]